MKQLHVAVLKGCLYMGTSLYILYVPSAFSGRAGFDMDANHIFPQGVLTATPLVESGLEMEGLKAGVECEKKLQVPLSVGFPLAPHWNPCPRVREY